MPDFYGSAFSDNYRMARSKPLSGVVAAGSYNLIRVPKFAFVNGVWVLVETACSATDVTVGWLGNGEAAQVAGFLSADVADVGVVGLKAAVKDSLVSFPGKYFSGGTGSISVTLGTAWTVGKLTVFAQYSVIH
jgi:hypothetical protein